MSKNLEIKVHCSSFSKVKDRLIDIKAEYAGELIQKDIYYKTKEGLLKLRIENGQQSLIKYLRDEKGKERWSDFQILKFASGDARKFFGNIFSIETTVEKKRLLYMFDNTRIHLDDVKNLGKFLELETLVINGLNDAKKRFNTILDLLNLDFNQQIKKSYKILIEENSK